MRKVIFTAIFVLIFFLIEFFLFSIAGRWFMPNMLLLLVIYFNLAFGIRFSLLSAVLAGTLKDSFSMALFGTNIFSFVVCAYMTTFLKRYFHYVASRSSRLLLVFFVLVIHMIVNFCIQLMYAKVNVIQAFQYVFVPEILATLFVTSFTFTQLRKCALRLFA